MTDVAKGQLVLHGYHVWQEDRVKNDAKGNPVTVSVDVTEPTAYVVDWTAILATKTLPVTFTVEGDRDFMLTHLTHNQADAAGFIPLRFQISDQSGKTLFRDAPYINAASSANAGQPFLLAQKRLYRRTSVVKVNFTVD